MCLNQWNQSQEAAQPEENTKLCVMENVGYTEHLLDEGKNIIW